MVMNPCTRLHLLPGYNRIAILKNEEAAKALHLRDAVCKRAMCFTHKVTPAIVDLPFYAEPRLGGLQMPLTLVFVVAFCAWRVNDDMRLHHAEQSVSSKYLGMVALHGSSIPSICEKLNTLPSRQDLWDGQTGKLAWHTNA